MNINGWVFVTTVKQNEMSLQFTSYNFKNFNEWVLVTAVKQNGMTLQLAPDRLKKEFWLGGSVVFASVKHKVITLFQFMSHTIQNNFLSYCRLPFDRHPINRTLSVPLFFKLDR